MIISVSILGFKRLELQNNLRIERSELFMAKENKGERIKRWNLYLVTEEELSAGRKTIDIVREAIAGGVKIIQLRDKNLPVIDRYRLGKEIREITLKHDVDFIVNDRIDLAMALDADGVHLGQEDLPLRVARKILGPEKIIGISASNIEEAKAAETGGADYLGVGSIYLTGSKKVGEDRRSIGAEGVAAIKRECPLPIIAIGGLKRENCQTIIQAGADAIAVITALTQAPDVAREAREFVKIIQRVKEGK
jgi:thiamine-phosphate pyrophosphorylase